MVGRIWQVRSRANFPLLGRLRETEWQQKGWMCSRRLDMFDMFRCVQGVWICLRYWDMFEIFRCV